MTIREHADRTESLLGHRAEEIHQWIDRYFDAEGFADFLRHGQRPGYDPYSHRKHRHCREALTEARVEFRENYPDEIIDAVMERHIRDDYEGYFPYREDFEKGTFREKYHEADSLVQEPDDLAAYFKGKHYEKAAASARHRGTRFLWRFLLPVFTALILLIGSLFVVIVPVSRENMLNLKKEMIRELTSVAMGALEHYADRSRSGLMEETRARFEAAEEIRRMRYGLESKEYYWIIDSRANMVMHPYQPELEGQNLIEYRDREDTDAVYLFREAAKLALKDGEGYIEYWWQHWDDPGATAPKLSYVRYFPEWDWIVGTGVYIHDVEDELDSLTRRLSIIYGAIALASIALLLWVLTGALRVERGRDVAEEGLKEAKERYRALAEASTEGYMLVAGGAVLFVNPALCRLLGRSEEDLLTSGPEGLLDVSMDIGHPARRALGALIVGEAPSGSWTVSTRRPDGNAQELQLGISRIFLPGSNGHVVSCRRPVTAGESIVTGEIRAVFKGNDPAEDIAAAISAAPDRIGVLETAETLGDRLSGLLASGAPALVMRQAVAEVYDACLARFADLAAEAVKDAGVEMAFVSLGSNARREMTPFSDQDGALIFAEHPDIPLEESRRFCLALATNLSSGLEKAGFPRCDGGVMPMNPRWCLSASEWNLRISEWIEKPSPQALLEMNVMLDRRHAWGSRELSSILDESFYGIAERSPGLIGLYRRNAMLYRPPNPRKNGGMVDIKEALKPLEIQVRLMSFIHGIPAVSTLGRLNALHGAGIIGDSSAADLRLAFETFWNLRFRKQLEGHRRAVRTDDSLNMKTLSDLERRNFSACLETVEAFVKRQVLESERY